jgi:hypothetical protein
MQSTNVVEVAVREYQPSELMEVKPVGFDVSEHTITGIDKDGAVGTREPDVLTNSGRRVKDIDM